ncbi:helix-turn-helix domain-containing protein [Flavobacteriaceae bacterium]|mgnify:CR=1 FL=1|jgi:transcriptional regulator with XRE-family HTH domain|nr:helix-turn-helix domain-containing protein [Flavobacteriaceae bacterium]MDB4227214.1 helix-turn-helix domain-containing protein [Flavobacteriaceae bacterium]MDC0001448.1 helix-turn-helix domain-containing protein [Flavobacteriaceae bacterium]|tara:strand:+ start:901 stop:1125 length:225 start_codon:yes stop_codon:yes gene_type:complete
MLITDLPEKTAKLLNLIRREKKISQEKLALKCGIDRKYVNIIEKGNSNISIGMLNKLCNGLEVEISDFFTKLGK